MNQAKDKKAMSAGSLFRGVLNDFKRRPEDAAQELGVPLSTIEGILSGQVVMSEDLVQRACQVWPVNPRDFATLIDDAPRGVMLMRAEESARTSRVMSRNGKRYYEYRDTACSRVSSFRPEWIKELHVVDDDDPGNPTLEWNNGHFMHQFTYFIGPVNFYFHNERGDKDVAVMNTGDTMYICPFVPHTFATRKNDQGRQGLILALTYGNNLTGDPQHELSAISSALSRGYCLDVSSPSAMTGELIRYHMSCLSLTEHELALRVGVTPERLGAVLHGEAGPPDHALLKAIASAMNVSLRDLLGCDDGLQRVVVNQGQGRTWSREGAGHRYTFRELASTRAVPLAKSLEVTIDAGPRGFGGDHCIGLHQYLYNVGESDVTIHWRHEDEVLSDVIRPGDSAYLKPFVKHDYTATHGVLLSLRIQSKVSGDCLRELSYIGQEHIHRIIAEDRQWFNAGRSQT